MPTETEMAKLKVGSRVVVHGFAESLAVITDETKTQWLIGKQRYRKRDGYLVGDDSWSRTYIRAATAKDVDSLIRSRLIAKLNRVGVRDLDAIDTECIEQACQLLGLSPAPGEEAGQ